MNKKALQILSDEALQERDKKATGQFKGILMVFSLILCAASFYTGYANAKGFEISFLMWIILILCSIGGSLPAGLNFYNVKKEIARRENNN